MTILSHSERGSPLRVRLSPGASGWYLGGGAVAIGVYFLLSPQPRDVLYSAIGLSAVLAIFAAVRHLEAERLAWRLFALGLFSQVIADSISSFYEIHLDREPPLPSVADAFYLGGYPLLALGIFLLLRRRGVATTLAASLDTLIVAAAVATVQWIFFVEPARHLAIGTGARAVDMAYPTMDTLLLVGLAQLLIGVGGRTRAYRLLIVSLGLWIFADELYALNASGYAAGGWLDAFWLGSYVVFGAAAFAARPAGETFVERRVIPRLTKGRLGLLAAALLAVPASLAVERAVHQGTHPIAAAIGASLIALLVLARFAGLVRLVDRARIEERRARHEAELAGRRVELQNEQLRELDRLKDEFVSSVSHELRTPLTSITGYVELLLEGAVEAESRRHLEIVQRNAARLLGLVRDLLFAARLQSGHLELRSEPVDLGVLVAEAVHSARPHAEAAKVALELRAEEVPPVDGEPARLSQLIDNLVSNAIKFTPAGGSVQVAVAAQNGDVYIEVSDTGIGITDAERDQIFERFFRTNSVLERQIPGTGLGLYITKAIVEAHGGRIDVRAAAGEGTTFVVQLPVTKP